MTRHAHWRTRLVERDAGYVTPCMEWSGCRTSAGITDDYSQYRQS
jgi:hypothetical protein